ncbi:SAGA-associated factor 29-like [Rhopilema esculentum]|uniref:SAGA-associated factor 29-like n=1 Tax=Rhopilema esculentum TaxID=499914 RepID=UPI0031E0FC80|eukprot:gene16038-7383_t
MATGNSSSGVPLGLQQALKELHRMLSQIQEERGRSADNLNNINKTHEKMKNDNKVSSYFKNKLKGLYNTAISDAKGEIDLIQQAMDKITEIKIARNEKQGSSKSGFNQEEPRKGMRRGVLMSMLQKAASTLPTWTGRQGESAPALCGCIPADSAYVCRPSAHVAARVKGSDGEEQWILAEVVAYNPSNQKYDVDDIDYTEEDGKASQERHHLSRRRVIPLPLWKADPNRNPEAIFQPNQLVMALYPQTTCFYRALIHEPPKTTQDDYSVLFEDTSYADGYSPPLTAPQRYVVQYKKK